jgi:calpain-15
MCETDRPNLVIKRAKIVNAPLSDFWQCNTCSLLNNEDKCEFCDTSKQHSFENKINNRDDDNNFQSIKIGWICKQCTFINEKTDEKCNICGLYNEIIRNEKKKSENQWNCEICDHKNTNLKSNKCNRCGSQAKTFTFHRQNSILIDEDDENFSSLASISMASLVRKQESKKKHKIYSNSIDEAKIMLQNLIQFCQENQHKFIDDGFPPCDKSLFSHEESRQKVLSRIKKIEWLSPEDIRVRHEDKKYKWTVYEKAPSSNDIKQGYLGNCWFLSALAVLCERPELIKEILITSEYSKEGCYLIRLCHNGEWKTVLVDDLFPCESIIIFKSPQTTIMGGFDRKSYG